MFTQFEMISEVAPNLSNRQYRVNEYFTYPLADDKNLVTTRHSAWVILNNQERQLLLEERVEESPELYDTLEGLGVILTEHNLPDVVQTVRNRYTHLVGVPKTLILVPTNRCNARCTYCHSKSELATDASWDMNEEILYQTMDFFLSVPEVGGPREIHFQGGEPLIRYDLIQKGMDYAIEKAERNGIENLTFTIVSNMTLMNDAIAQDIKERGNISLGSSLDGPELINDKQRYFASGKGMYQKIVRWVKKLKQEYGLHVNVMPVLTVNHIGYEKELIDQYLELDLSGIYLKYVSVQGPHERAYSLKFAPEQYVDFWKKGLEYILEINKNGRFFMEGETMVMLQNVLLDTQDFMCLQRPCGAGTSMLTVDQNGDIFLCDLGRSIDLMKFGNVMTHTYDEVITSESARILRGIASETLPKCNSCVFSGYCGHCAVRSIREHGSPLPEGPDDFECEVALQRWPYLFRKLIDPQDSAIMTNWVKAYRDSKSVDTQDLV